MDHSSLKRQIAQQSAIVRIFVSLQQHNLIAPPFLNKLVGFDSLRVTIHPTGIHLGPEENWPLLDVSLRFPKRRIEYVIEHDAERFGKVWVGMHLRRIFHDIEMSCNLRQPRAGRCGHLQAQARLRACSMYFQTLSPGGRAWRKGEFLP